MGVPRRQNRTRRNRRAPSPASSTKNSASTPPSATASPHIRHTYRNGGAIDLQFFVVHEFTGEIENRIFNDVRWAPLTALPTYDFLAADLDLIRDLSEGKLL